MLTVLHFNKEFKTSQLIIKVIEDVDVVVVEEREEDQGVKLVAIVGISDVITFTREQIHQQLGLNC
jgi:hypothetical protein